MCFLKEYLLSKNSCITFGQRLEISEQLFIATFGHTVRGFKSSTKMTSLASRFFFDDADIGQCDDAYLFWVWKGQFVCSVIN